MHKDEAVPHHDLRTVQQHCGWRWRTITLKASAEAQLLGFEEEDIDSCILALTPGDYHKSMPDDKFPGCFLDVYRPLYLGKHLYVKFGMPDSWVKIISFKEDTSK